MVDEIKEKRKKLNQVNPDVNNNNKYNEVFINLAKENNRYINANIFNNNIGIIKSFLLTPEKKGRNEYRNGEN